MIQIRRSTVVIILIALTVVVGLAIWAWLCSSRTYNTQIEKLKLEQKVRQGQFDSLSTVYVFSEKKLLESDNKVQRYEFDIQMMLAEREQLSQQLAKTKKYYENRSVYITTLDSSGKSVLWSEYIERYRQRFGSNR